MSALTERKLQPWVLRQHPQMARQFLSSSFQSLLTLGLAHPSSSERHAHQRAEAWRWPVLLALLATIPAFYLELMDQAPVWAPESLYLLGATVLGLALWRVAAATQRPWRHVRRNWLDGVQIAGLLACAILPTSMLSHSSLTIRLAMAALTLIRIV